LGILIHAGDRLEVVPQFFLQNVKNLGGSASARGSLRDFAIIFLLVLEEQVLQVGQILVLDLKFFVWKFKFDYLK